MALATTDDVAIRLGKETLDADELIRAPGLLEESTDLVIGHLGFDPTDVDDVDLALLARVVSRMTARVLEQSKASGGVFGATAMTDQIGDFSQTRQFPAGSTNGGPWLASADKIALKNLKGAGAYAVDTAPTGYTLHADVCALVFGAGYCDCGSDLNSNLGPIF
jgi:hypothetical protein